MDLATILGIVVGLGLIVGSIMIDGSLGAFINGPAARAVAGVRYLTEKLGVEESRISAAGFAHTRPITTAETPEARAQNRRLEFVFYREEDEEPGPSGVLGLDPERGLLGLDPESGLLGLGLD